MVAAHVAAGGQRLERGQRVRAADRLVAAAVHQLEQLDGELHVPQAALAQLELAVRLGRRHVVLDAPAHRLGVLDEVLALDGSPDQRRDRLGVGPAHLAVAGDHARLEQGLELPGLGPALVVRQVAGHGAHQRALLALGTQRRVHRPQRGLAGRGRARLGHPGGQPRRHRQRLVLGHAVDGLGDVDDVHVRDVVELAAAGLAHAEHREPRRTAPARAARRGPAPDPSRARPPPGPRAPTPPRAAARAAPG